MTQSRKSYTAKSALTKLRALLAKMRKELSLRELSTVLPDTWLARLMFIAKLGYQPRFKNPRSFNEKINFIKLYNRNPLRSTVADRVAVRDYVKDKAPDCALVPLLWHGVEISESLWNSLPSEFAIKASHGSQMTRLVNKQKDSFASVRDDVERWMNTDYARLGREWVYRGVERQVVVEGLVTLDSGKLPSDFKFFAANGQVHMVQVDLDRFVEQKRNLYDADFNPIEGQLVYSNGPTLQKPKMYDKARNIAEALSRDFDLMRVDLFIMEDKVYLGEMTNTPGNGFRKFTPKALDFWLGEKLSSHPVR